MAGMKGYIGQLAALAALSQIGGKWYRLNETTPENIDVRPPDVVVPKGCKKYIYNESFGTLTVIASSEKQALRKYNKWVKQNQSS